MATVKFYHDCRAVANNETAPLKIAITQKGKTALLNLNISLLPQQWDKRAEKIINHPNKQMLNLHITRRKMEVEAEILKLMESGNGSRMTATQIKNYIISDSEVDKSHLFSYRLQQFADKHDSTTRTRAMYLQTLKRMRDFASNIDALRFEDITYEWLTKFEAFLALTASKNARNIHLRNIRAVFNDALDDEITSAYPFRRFKIRPEPTIKRALTVEQLRTLFNYPVEDYAQIHLDMFKLIFFLIGINIVDLFRLKEISNEGRAEYKRAKTHRLYSIKVEPEALYIINRYRGKRALLCIGDSYKNHQDYAKHLNRALQRIGEVEVGKQGKKTITPLFPIRITTYWARHTWATIAASLDIPKETIAAALGHSSNTVTDIYIDFDRRKIDEANRRVIDWVLYEKR